MALPACLAETKHEICASITHHRQVLLYLEERSEIYILKEVIINFLFYIDYLLHIYFPDEHHATVLFLEELMRCVYASLRRRSCLL